MEVGIIGAGKVGTNLGRYARSKGVPIVGYYDRVFQDAQAAATVTQTEAFEDLSDLILASDTLWIATPDDVIQVIWDDIARFDIRDYVVVHFSGSLSSDVFTTIQNKRAHGCSVHPIFAFSDKNIPIQQLNTVTFTIEGDSAAVAVMRDLLREMGNPVVEIDSQKKARYHLATSLVSNHVLGVLQSGIELMEDCGFSEEEAYKALTPLVLHNVEAGLAEGCIAALTGPIERGDAGTVAKHMEELQGNTKDIYAAIGKKLVEMAKCKHPDRDYGCLSEWL